MQLPFIIDNPTLDGLIGQLGVLLIGAAVIRVAFGVPDAPVGFAALWAVFGCGCLCIIYATLKRRPSHD